jgi:hypothetical protein
LIQGPIPDEKYFFEFTDTKEIRNQKIDFVNKNKCKIGVFQKELFKSL